MMNKAYRDLLKHSGIYGIGHLLSRLSSLLLLPLYTRYLTPADYGCITILDLTNTVLGILIGVGIAQAATRFHFDASNDLERNRVWWTAGTIIALMATLLIAPSWIFRSSIAYVMLGPEQPDGALYYALTLPTLGFSSIEILLMTYLQVRKWSVVFVAFSLTRLGIGIALNVSLVVGFKLGILGILIGNLTVGALSACTLLAIFISYQRPYSIHSQLFTEFASYGSPLIVTTILAFFMHQADRYFLRLFLDLEQVGLYSIAYQIGQGANALIILPFSSIWNVIKFEIAEQPDASILYSTIFQYFMFALILCLFAVSLFIEPILKLMIAPDYLPAADITPIICLGYVFFSMVSFVTLSAALHKKTQVLIIPSLIAASVNLAGNMIIIPIWGALGAGFVTVLTFAVLMISNHLVCRRIAPIEFGLTKVIKILGVCVLTYIAFYLIRGFITPIWLLYAMGGVVWLIFARFLLANKAPEIKGLLGALRHNVTN